MLSLILAVALNAQPTPTPCVPDLQAGGQPLRPCAPPKPVLMAVSNPLTSVLEPVPVEVPLISRPALGGSCAEDARRVAAIQAATPDGEPVPQAYEVTCRAGKIVAAFPPVSEAMPNLYRAKIGCQPIANEIARRVDAAMAGKRPVGIYAVMRQVDGCGVPTPVGYHPDYLAPGAADPQSAKPVDGPGRKR